MKMLAKLCLFFVVLGLTSCGYVGPIGPQGEPGKDGTPTLTGHGIPSDTLGGLGDSYVDLDTWDFYVKNENGWILEGNIKADSNGSSSQHEGTEGLLFYPLNDKECAVSVGTARFLTDIVVPEKYQNYVVTTICGPFNVIASGGFGNCHNLKTIELPETITNIGDYAFEGCSSLTDINIPNTVKTIGKGAFQFCRALKSLSFDESNVSVGDYAFKGCNNLTLYLENDSLLPIFSNAIENTTSIYCGDKFYQGIYQIGQLKYLIQEGTYAYLTDSIGDIDSYVIVESVVSIGNYKYEVTKILDNFSDNHQIFALYVPTSIINLTNTALSKVSNVFFEDTEKKNTWSISNYENYYFGTKKVEIINSNNFETFLVNDTIAYIFRYSGSDAIVRVPSTIFANEKSYKVERILHQAFANNHNITNVQVADGILYIGSSCFYSCINLTKVYFPKSIIWYGENVFYDTAAITNVWVDSYPSDSALQTSFTSVDNLYYRPITYLICDNKLTNGYYIGPDNSCLSPTFASDGGIELSLLDFGLMTTTFLPRPKVIASIEGKVSTRNKTASNTNKDIFTFYGLNKDGEIVAEAFSDGDSVILEGKDIVQVEVIMTNYYKSGSYYYNLSISSFEILEPYDGPINNAIETAKLLSFNYYFGGEEYYSEDKDFSYIISESEVSLDNLHDETIFKEKYQYIMDGFKSVDVGEIIEETEIVVEDNVTVNSNFGQRIASRWKWIVKLDTDINVVCNIFSYSGNDTAFFRIQLSIQNIDAS